MLTSSAGYECGDTDSAALNDLHRKLVAVQKCHPDQRSASGCRDKHRARLTIPNHRGLMNTELNFAPIRQHAALPTYANQGQIRY